MDNVTRSSTTRTALLAAARDVFTESGYVGAAITDIVDRAGLSVGSLYHHFASKYDVYLALYDGYQDRQAHRAAREFRTYLAGGEQSALRLFIAATRPYLEGCWSERALARLFLPGRGPAGFDSVTRERFQLWVGTNTALLSERTEPLSDALVLVLTSISHEAGYYVMTRPTKKAAYAFIDEVLELMSRLGQ